MQFAQRRSISRSKSVTTVEPLELRQLLASIVVNSTSDATSLPAGQIDLREAIKTANTATSAITITFGSTFATHKTIVLAGSALELTNTHESTTIIGPSGGLTISGAKESAVFQIDAKVTARLTNLTSTNGSEEEGELAGGGTIYNDGTLTLTDVNLTAGNSTDDGGGIYNDDHGSVTMTGGIVADNSAIGGGGISNLGTMKMVDVTVSGNGAEGGGGISNGGTMTLTDMTISGNSSGRGGGIDNGGMLTMTNVTVAGNSTSLNTGGDPTDGAGVNNDFGGKVTLVNVTISGNSAGSGRGSGVENDNGAENKSGVITVENSIIAANEGQTGPDVEGTFKSLGNNLIGITNGSTGWKSSDLTGTTAHPLSAKLGSLASNGGATKTMLPQTGSPTINAGSNSLIPSGVTTDQRGLPRISGGKVDIGAVEVQAAALSISGEVFNDANASGTLDSGETGLKNVRVYVDVKNTGSYVSTDPSAVTNSSGQYTITGVPAGTDVLRQVLPSGYRQTLPNNGASLKVTVGSSNVTKQNFGDSQKVRLSGFAYNDLNHDGKREANEPFLSGVTIYLDKNGNKKLDSGEPSTTTNSGGFWIISDLSPGTYTARFDAKGTYASYLQTQPASNGGLKVTLSNGQVGDDLLFGIYKPASMKPSSVTQQVSDVIDETTNAASSNINLITLGSATDFSLD